MAGATLIAALDKWKLATDTYKLNFPHATVYQMSASLLSPQQVLDEVGGSISCSRHQSAPVTVWPEGTSRDVRQRY